MRRFLICFFVLICILFPLIAQEHQLVGIWVGTDGKTTYEIIDGFKANSGAVLAIESGVETDLGSWEYKDGSYVMQVGWYSYDVTFVTEDVMQFGRDAFKRSEKIEETGIVSIKTDEQAFIHTLGAYSWLDGEDGKTVLFRTTFSNDSGVQEKFSADGTLYELESWAIGSGVLKIGSTTLVDSRVSDRYLIGLDQYDNFVVYKCLGDADEVDRTSLKNEREAFLAALTTDGWFTTNYYSGPTIHRFRPIESELKGRVVQTRANELYSWSVWEYSPQAGTVKIGYTTYTGAILVGDTMAFVDSSGNQVFYRRLPGGENHRFTVGDVVGVPLSETNIDKISSILNGQFQSGEYVYTFDFSDDRLNGYVHKFTTEPFKVIGNKFTNNIIGNSERLWAVEDVVVFDERNVLKRDTQKVWLKSIGNEESEALQQRSKDASQSFLDKHVVVRIRTRDGKTINVELPVSSFSDITDLTLLVE